VGGLDPPGEGIIHSFIHSISIQSFLWSSFLILAQLVTQHPSLSSLCHHACLLESLDFLCLTPYSPRRPCEEVRD
jgi:hypothetical protein